MHVPIMSLCLIMEFGEKSLLDWSLIRCSASVPGFGTVWWGQKPLHSEQHTDSTVGWLGCLDRSSLKRSTLMGVVILKICGCVLIVSTAAVLSNSSRGTTGTGAVVMDHRAVALRVSSLLSHKRPWVYFGCLAQGSSTPWLCFTICWCTYDSLELK